VGIWIWKLGELFKELHGIQVVKSSIVFDQRHAGNIAFNIMAPRVFSVNSPEIEAVFSKPSPTSPLSPLLSPSVVSFVTFKADLPGK